MHEEPLKISKMSNQISKLEKRLGHFRREGM